MTWLELTLLSAIPLGCYDYFKKVALQHNAVAPVLLGSVATGALFWVPWMVWSMVSPATLPASMLNVSLPTWQAHGLLALKSILVGISWWFGYSGIRLLPISIASPIRATGPLWTILFAVCFFGEHPTAKQWLGVTILLASFYAFSFIGKHEGICFRRHRGVLYMIAATLTGAASSIYDKLLLQKHHFSPGQTQAWFTGYMAMMLLIPLWMWYRDPNRQPFRFHWAIPTIGLTLLIADLLYFTAIQQPDAMISLISPVRRSSVLISFFFAIVVYREQRILIKSCCLLALIAGLVLLA